MTKHGCLRGWVLALGLMAGDANAQSVARSFDDLRGDLKGGDIVLVALQDGETVWGQVEELSSAGLTLFTGERVGAGASFPKSSRRVLSENGVIEIRRSDAAAVRGAQLFSRPARSFADLSRVLKSGDRVTITETDGKTSRGVVAAVSPTELTLRESAGFRLARPGDPLPGSTPRSFQSDRVASVARGGDSVWNGTLIGAGIALGLGVASVATATGDASDGIAALPAAALMGAGVGFLVDWSIGRKQTLWSTGGSRARAEVSPIVGRGTKGVALSLRF